MRAPDNPFGSIEGAYEYVALLVEALDEASRAIQDETAAASRSPNVERRLEALHLVDYKLAQLRGHLTASRRILNDLRTLRRLLLRDAPTVDEDRPV